MKLRLTDMAIKKLPLPEDSQVTHWDTLTPAFGLRCSKKSKSFVVMYGPKRQLKTIGRYPNITLADARSAAKRFFVEYEAGAFSEPAKSVSFEMAKDRFLADCRGRNKPRTVADYKRLLGKHFRFRSAIGDITRQQIMKVITGLSDTPSERSHAYVAIRTMMNWCVRHGLIEQSVVPAIKHGGEARARVLNEEELRQVFEQARQTPYPFGPIVQLLVLTGQRRSEIGLLRSAWIRDDLIVFPEGFSKNKREHQFPVTPLVREVLKELPQAGEYLFHAASDHDKPFTGWAYHKAKFDKELSGVAPYTLHDLRRTFSTIHAQLGTPIHVTERLLNHVTGTVSGVAAVYNRHSYLPEMRAAQEAYEAFVSDLVAVA